jgi:hypothetical protein
MYHQIQCVPTPLLSSSGASVSPPVGDEMLTEDGIGMLTENGIEMLAE